MRYDKKNALKKTPCAPRTARRNAMPGSRSFKKGEQVHALVLRLFKQGVNPAMIALERAQRHHVT